MTINRRSEWPQWALLAGMFLLAAITWPSAPDQIPVRWDLSGQVTGYASKASGLLGLPLTALGMYLLLLFIPRIDPGRDNYRRFAGAYTTLRVSILALLAAVYGIIQLWLRGQHIDVSRVVAVLIGALFIVLGTLSGRLEPNWFVGIRTPWTLSSHTAWVKTHRLAGWVLGVQGLAITAIAVVRSRWAAAAGFAILVAGIVWLVIYSYLVWRDAPDKIPPAGFQKNTFSSR